MVTFSGLCVRGREKLDINISLEDLDQYMEKVDDRALLTKQIPNFPATSCTDLNFLDPSSNEAKDRKDHVDPHYPPMYPEKEIACDETPKTKSIAGGTVSQVISRNDMKVNKPSIEHGRILTKQEMELNPFKNMDFVNLASWGDMSPGEDKLLDSLRSQTDRVDSSLTNDMDSNVAKLQDFKDSSIAESSREQMENVHQMSIELNEMKATSNNQTNVKIGAMDRTTPLVSTSNTLSDKTTEMSLMSNRMSHDNVSSDVRDGLVVKHRDIPKPKSGPSHKDPHRSTDFNESMATNFERQKDVNHSSKSLTPEIPHGIDDTSIFNRSNSAKDGLAGNKDDMKDLKIVIRAEVINL